MGLLRREKKPILVVPFLCVAKADQAKPVEIDHSYIGIKDVNPVKRWMSSSSENWKRRRMNPRGSISAIPTGCWSSVLLQNPPGPADLTDTSLLHHAGEAVA